MAEEIDLDWYGVILKEDKTAEFVQLDTYELEREEIEKYDLIGDYFYCTKYLYLRYPEYEYDKENSA